jgi:hypothetical protein
MSTKVVFLQGPVKWAKVFEGNRNKGTEKYPVAAGGQYEISLGLNAKDLKEVKSYNRLYGGKVYDKLDKNYLPGDSKLTYITFKRKHEHLKNNGDVIHEWSGAPDVRADDNTPWGKDLIGNGSVCTVKLDVTTKGGKTFVRLEGLRVDEHVEYEGAEGDNEPATEENRTDGLAF